MQIMTPEHVAIIMDGNGRWAKNRGKLRIFGHRAGLVAVKKIIKHAVKRNIPALTLYAFSSENWHRPPEEVSALLSLFIKSLSSEVKLLKKTNIQLNIVGDITRFKGSLQAMIRQAESLTATNDGLVLNVALNYGGRWDITQAVKAIATQVESKAYRVEDIDEALIDKLVCFQGLPSVDLVIRTGGEHRISNFLLWQIAYSELYFTDVLWPDFSEKDLDDALNDFAGRDRRFGATEPV